MAEDELKSSKRILDPLERSSEVLFGLIMVLGFTSTISAARAGRPEIRTMIIGALGCNLAWGIVDAIMYLMATLSEKGHGLATLNAVRSASSAESAYRVIREGLPPILARSMLPAHFEQIRQHLLHLRDVPPRVRLRADDWRGATGVFLLVFLSTFPVVAPFFFTTHVRDALRASHLVAIVMLAITGYSYGRYSGGRRWLWSLSMVLLGVAMVVVTVKLGG
jgi:VIT family